MRRAEKMVKTLRKHLPTKVGYLYPWCNGREQGFHLVCDGLAVCFAENRNSDSIVVYAGENVSFDITTYQPSEDLWKNRQLFDNEVLAVKFIVDFFARVPVSS
jgi:hypothetical protein